MQNKKILFIHCLFSRSEIKLCLLVVYSLFTCCLGSVVFAQSPTPEEAPTPEVTQVDNEKIKEIRDEVEKKIQEKIQEIKEKGKLRGYVGEILNIDGLEITLETRRGEREITVDEEAAIVGPGRKKIDLEDLEVGNIIICMGNVDSEGKMIVRRLVVIPKPSKPPEPRRATYGQVTEIHEDSLILTLIHPRKQTSTLRVETTSKTRITKKIEGEMEEVSFDDIKTDDRLVAIGTWDEDEEILTAKLIHIIPRKAKGQEE